MKTRTLSASAAGLASLLSAGGALLIGYEHRHVWAVATGAAVISSFQWLGGYLMGRLAQ